MHREVFGLLRVYFFFIHSNMELRAGSVFATPSVMVLGLNESLKNRELIPTPDCSGPASFFFPFYREYSSSPMSSTMPEKTLFRYPEFSYPKKFTSDC